LDKNSDSVSDSDVCQIKSAKTLKKKDD